MKDSTVKKVNEIAIETLMISVIRFSQPIETTKKRDVSVLHPPSIYINFNDYYNPIF